MKQAVFMVGVPLTALAFNDVCHLDYKQTNVGGYIVRVVNQSSQQVKCYLTRPHKRPKKIIIPSYSQTERFYFTALPKLKCFEIDQEQNHEKTKNSKHDNLD